MSPQIRALLFITNIFMRVPLCVHIEVKKLQSQVFRGTHKGTSIYSKNFLEGALVGIYRGQKLSKVEFLEVPISK